MKLRRREKNMFSFTSKIAHSRNLCFAACLRRAELDRRALVLGPTSQLYYSECCAPNSSRSTRVQTSPDLADGQWHA